MKNEVRTCNKCGKTKPLDEFVFEKRSGDYLNTCLECHKQYHKEYYERLKAKNAGKKVVVDPSKTKKCIKCGMEKPQTEFGIDKANAKIMNVCKACKALTTKQYYLGNKDKIIAYAREYREANKEKIDTYMANYRKEHAEERRAYSRQYELDHPDEVRARRKAYRQAHKDEFRERDKRYSETHKKQIAKRYKEWAKEHAGQLAEYNKKYRKENAEEISKKRQEYDKRNRKRITQYYINKRNTDPLFRLSTQIRNLINKSLKNRGYGKDTHTYEILGCDYETLWEHLKQTWLDNYGTEWDGEDYHIDHIIPLATAKTRQEVIDLCYYENLQLLKPKDNLVKNKSLDWQLDPKSE
ncbi:hypothetical protein IJG79_02535 [Candidatus Saccharibacteria bacterium]|nr:hypothetical protein [Candidatus Saccharibacteria bacterium]